jgi:hypothetical protein
MLRVNCNRQSVAAISIALALSACSRTSRTGPQRIEADGRTYMACGGAISLPNTHEPKDNEPATYVVLFRDSRGVDHTLQKVRNLTITDLPPDTPECLHPPQAPADSVQPSMKETK